MNQPPLSIIDGGPAPADISRNLTGLLPRAARLPGGAISFVNGAGAESHLTYQQLLNRASRVLRGLRAAARSSCTANRVPTRRTWSSTRSTPG